MLVSIFCTYNLLFLLLKDVYSYLHENLCGELNFNFSCCCCIITPASVKDVNFFFTSVCVCARLWCWNQSFRVTPPKTQRETKRPSCQRTDAEDREAFKLQPNHFHDVFRGARGILQNTNLSTVTWKSCLRFSVIFCLSHQTVRGLILTDC